MGEGLAGTTAEASRWLLLEYPNEWKPKGYEQALLPDAARVAIDAAIVTNRSVRVQLIRRAERRAGDAGVRLFLACSERGREQLWEFVLPDYAALASLDLVAWATGADPFVAARRDKPLYLVCVHGKRDRCCAQKGMPVYRRLCEARPEETWQTTHLGGHRFAATLVCLPEGVCYGRVEESEVPSLVTAHERGELYDLERYRGRSCDDPNTQAAEMLLRTQLRAHALDALLPVGREPLDQVERVTFSDHAGAVHVVAVTKQKLPLIQPSCDAPERKPGVRFVRL